MIVDALPVGVAGHGRAPHHPRRALRPRLAGILSFEESLGPGGRLQGHVFHQLEHAVRKALVQPDDGAAVEALVVEPGGLRPVSHLPRIGPVSEIEIHGGGDHVDVAEDPVSSRRSPAPDAQDVRFREIEAVVRKDRRGAQGRIDFPLAEKEHRDAVSVIQPARLRRSFDVIRVAAGQIFLIEILRFPGKIPRELALFEFRKDQDPDGDLSVLRP